MRIYLVTHFYMYFFWCLIYFFRSVCTILGLSVFQWKSFSKVSSFRKFVMKLSFDTHLRHLFSLQSLRSVRLLLELSSLNDDFLFPLSFLFWLKKFLVGRDPPQWLHLDWLKKNLYFLPNCPNPSKKIARQIKIIVFINTFFFPSYFYFMTCCMSRLFTTFVIIV